MKHRPWSSPFLRLGATRVRVFWLRVLLLGLALGVGGLAWQQWPLRPKAPGIEAGRAPCPVAAQRLPEITYPDLNEPANPERDALEAKLRSSTVSLSFRDRPLADALVELGSKLGVSIAPDQTGLELIQDSDEGVSLNLSGVSGWDALNLTLSRTPNLIAVVESNHVRVTDSEEGGLPKRLEIYPVGDLTAYGIRKRGVSVGAEKLVELIENAIDRESESVLDQTVVDDTATETGHELSRRLIVRGPVRAHRAVIRVLRLLREGPQSSGESPPWVSELRARLQSERVSLVAKDSGIERTLRSLAEQAGIPLTLSPELDGKAFKVTLSIQGLPAGQVLDLILAQHGLGWTMRNQTLLVGSAESCRAPMSLRITPLDDLLGPVEDEDFECGCLSLKPAREPQWVSAMDPDRLIEIILAETGENGWENPASLEVHRGQLIVNQTVELHAKVDRLLDKLREHKWVYRNPDFKASGDNGVGPQVLDHCFDD